MILFIDTAFKETRIAIKKNDIFFQVVINGKINISKVINKELKKLLERSHSCQKDISLICFNSGPGNFTSLRVTLSCVKALGFYLNIPVVKLNSFQILALSNKDLDIGSPFADDFIIANPNVNAGFAISPSKPPLSFHLSFVSP